MANPERIDYEYNEQWIQLRLSMSEAVMNALNHYWRMTSRATRSEFWWWWLFALIVCLGFEIVSRVTGFDALAFVAPALLAVPTFTVSARRLHDTDHSAWWLLSAAVPVLGWIWLLMLLLAPSTPGENDWGEEPNVIRTDQI